MVAVLVVHQVAALVAAVSVAALAAAALVVVVLLEIGNTIFNFPI